jgi:L-asparaginase
MCEVKIFTTGGTIDKVYFDAQSTYEVGEPQVVDILHEANVTLAWELETLFRKDSLELTDEDRAVIVENVRQESCPRILITHGTDTMIETARVLQGIEGKTIVLVGSLSPARFKRSDAEFNIGFALAAVQTLPPGVYIAMNGRIFTPDRVRKNREANRFEAI